MAIEWNWNEKIGEVTILQTYGGKSREFTQNLYNGNAYLIFIREWTEDDGVEKYEVCNFWLDKSHMKNCLGLNKKGGYGNNIHSYDGYRITKFRLSKKCRNLKEIIDAITQAFDNITIEIYTEE